MKLSFRPYESQDHAVLSQYIFGLYREDTEGQEMTQQKIDRTIVTLAARPDLGAFMLFDYEGETVGYSLLVNFWSNEYGGIIITIDELYVHQQFRKKGIASAFIRHLQQHNDGAVALRLEVMPSNDQALQLYLKLGFALDINRHLIWC